MRKTCLYIITACMMLTGCAQGNSGETEATAAPDPVTETSAVESGTTESSAEDTGEHYGIGREYYSQQDGYTPSIGYNGDKIYVPFGVTASALDFLGLEGTVSAGGQITALVPDSSGINYIISIANPSDTEKSYKDCVLVYFENSASTSTDVCGIKLGMTLSEVSGILGAPCCTSTDDFLTFNIYNGTQDAMYSVNVTLTGNTVSDVFIDFNNIPIYPEGETETEDASVTGDTEWEKYLTPEEVESIKAGWADGGIE